MGAERSISEASNERYHWAAQRLMMKPSPTSIADVGCGLQADRLWELLPRRLVVGVDISLSAKPVATPFVLANAEVQRFSGFDAVVCLEALSHFIDPYTWIKNLDVPEVVLSMPTTPSRSVYEWRKHDIPEGVFREMLEPKWRVVAEFRQEISSTEGYVTLHGIRYR